MKKLSYVVVSKNDNYDPNNLEKLYVNLVNNLNSLKELNVDVEPVLVDWCSEKYLFEEETIQSIQHDINHVIVDPSLLEKDGLDKNMFYEYFAKNVGIKHSTGEYILIQNSDVVNSEELAKSIKSMLDYGIKGVYGRPTIRLSCNYPNLEPVKEVLTIWDKPFADMFPGDFLLVHRDDMINLAQGYDETNPNHRRKVAQTHMDVEILLQMNYKNIRPFFLNGHYWHFDHAKSHDYQNSLRNVQGYTNREGWGYEFANKEQLAGNVIKLFS